ncbi:MAG: hypothetical protein H7A25_02860 [Leptospiraceae bacterium]|nr:hypothetical protein [Leptospiraceae bacterium]MCP5498819.1 hypothetical protein [Leptospiraceae bacterium]
MILWIDAQLSPSLAVWIQEEFRIETYSLKYIGLRDAKDSDFLVLLKKLHSSPKIILVTVGNTSSER